MPGETAALPEKAGETPILPADLRRGFGCARRRRNRTPHASEGRVARDHPDCERRFPAELSSSSLPLDRRPPMAYNS